MRMPLAIALFSIGSCAGPGSDKPADVAPSPIVFSSDASGHFQLYSCNVDGSGLRNISASTTDDTSPRWSPSGDRIAFVAAKTLTLVDGDGGRRESLGVVADGVWNWSPAGDRIICQAGRDLVIVDVATRQTSTAATNCVGASWMPDGRLLVSQSLMLRVVADGQSTSFLKGAPELAMRPQVGGTWSRGPSPRCAFASASDTGGELFVVDVDGTHAKKVFSSVDSCWPWDWSPDGTALLVTTKEQRAGKVCGDVFIVQVGTGRQAKLTKEAAFVAGASWKP